MPDIQAKLLEEKLLRGIRAKRRFRAAIRHVIHNLPWLQEDDIIDLNNVRKTVNVLARKKKSAKGLTIKEKAILRKEIDYRTAEEIKHLNKVIGGLKCFRSYPEHVQTELVGVTFFEFYPAGRMLIRQDSEAHAMYFLLTGEAVVTKTVKDEITNEYVEAELGRVPAGSIFGEISLLHNVPRTATVTTTAPCEMIILRKEDFDRVLRKSLMQRWEEIRSVMLKFMYFDQWSSISLKECCILSKLKFFEPNQIVYGDGKNKKRAQKQTYFLIEGKCTIVEHILVKETVRLGVKNYKLYEPTIEEEEDIQSAVNVFCNEFCDDRNSSSMKSDETNAKLSSYQFSDVRLNITPSRQHKTNSISIAQSVNSPFSIMTFKHLLEKEQKAQNINIYQKQRESLPSNVEIKFMQICILREKGTFIEGDIMKNRRVISLTPCKFLLIPSYWLIQHNKGNVWVRIEHFLYRTLPSTQKVFEIYVRNQKWLEYKKKLRNATLEEKKYYNKTTIHDVPYSIRVMNNY